MYIIMIPYRHWTPWIGHSFAVETFPESRKKSYFRNDSAIKRRGGGGGEGGGFKK